MLSGARGRCSEPREICSHMPRVVIPGEWGAGVLWVMPGERGAGAGDAGRVAESTVGSRYRAQGSCPCMGLALTQRPPTLGLLVGPPSSPGAQVDPRGWTHRLGLALTQQPPTL